MNQSKTSESVLRVHFHLMQYFIVQNDDFNTLSTLKTLFLAISMRFSDVYSYNRSRFLFLFFFLLPVSFYSAIEILSRECAYV